MPQSLSEKCRVRESRGAARIAHARPEWYRRRTSSDEGTEAPTMTVSSIDLDLEPMPAPPANKDWPIGCIGAGFIMADVQIPSYLAAGYSVAAIASRTQAH